MKNIKEYVRHVLLTKPKTRDNDHLLMVFVWVKNNPALKDPKYQFRAFANDYMDGKYAHFESVRRVRQALQREHPELRGRKYNERHNLEKEVRAEIGSL